MWNVFDVTCFFKCSLSNGIHDDGSLRYKCTCLLILQEEQVEYVEDFEESDVEDMEVSSVMLYSTGVVP